MKKTMLILALAAAMLVSVTTMADNETRIAQRNADARYAKLTQEFADIKERCETAEEKVSKLTRALAATKVEVRAAKAATTTSNKTNENSSSESSKAASRQRQN